MRGTGIRQTPTLGRCGASRREGRQWLHQLPILVGQSEPAKPGPNTSRASLMCSSAHVGRMAGSDPFVQPTIFLDTPQLVLS